MRRAALRAVILLPLLGALSCDVFGPAASTLSIELDRAPADAGGVILAVDGGPVESVTAAAGYQVWHRSNGAGRTTILVRGALAPGPLVVIDVADRKRSYTVTVQHGAAGAEGGYARQESRHFGVALERR